MNWLWFLGCLIGGFGAIKYSKWIGDNTTHIDFADRLFGPTGTYTFWKIMGVLAIMFGFYALFNLK